MTHPTFGFATTREMHIWIDSTEISGPCSVVDNWTYGICEITPVTRQYGYGSEVRTFTAKDIRMCVPAIS